MPGFLRRDVIAGFAAAPLLAPTLAHAAAAPVAETRYGRVAGVVDRGVSVFKAIPYGADTGGANRFRRAKPPTSWAGVRPARDYGDQCPQVGILATGIYASRGPVHPDSENCLVLNVWTPQVAKGRRPVMVWLHGGGFESGSGSNIWYDGVNLCNRGDVVVVTINHRLNVFGFAYLAGLGGEGYADSGMVGMLDVVDALKWVRDNIAAFGGDPSNVTVFGESGGGRKISVLAAMPEAKGLFHRGIIQSGSALRMRTTEDGTRNAGRLLKALDLAPTDVARLADVPTKTLLAAGLAASKATNASLPSDFSFVPVVDGHNLTHDPFVPNAPPESADVPLIIGWTRTETSRLIGARDADTWALDEAGLRAKVATYVPNADPEKIIAGFRAANPGASPSDLFFLITTGTGVRAEVLTQVQGKAALRRAPVYSYCLAWKTPVDGGKWKSPHGLDIPFVFDTVALSPSLTGPVTEQTRAVSEDMTGAWLAFAKTGKPGTSRLAWPAYDLQRRATMVFDTPSRVVDDAFGAERIAAIDTPVFRAGG